MYGSANFFRDFSRQNRLAYRCCSLLVWLCLVSSLSPALSDEYPYPWNPYSVYRYIPLGSSPTRYYSEAEILSLWTNNSALTSVVPANYLDSIGSIYGYLAEHRPNDVTPPVLTAETSVVFNLSVEESFIVSTNQLVSVHLAPTVYSGRDNLFLNCVIFPAFLSSWYGFGYYNPSGTDHQPSSPVFSWLFTTNLLEMLPYGYQDWQEPGPLVWRRQDAPSSLNRSSAWFSGGSLRSYHVNYSFPYLPNMGNFPERGVYPVRPHTAFSFLDEYWLPWYWQTLKGLVVWDASLDTIKIKNVLRFSSPTNSMDGAQ